MLRKIIKCLNVLFFGKFFEKLALFYGVASGREHFAILRSLNEIRMVIDVGSNRGQFLLCACAAIPQIKAFSFEPLLSAFQILSKVLKLIPSSYQVQAFNCAVGSNIGNAEINVSKQADSSSLLSITSKQSDIFKGTQSSHKETILVSTLDTELEKMNIPSETLLKIDIQGFELEALKGGTNLLGIIKYVYVECSFQELYKGQALAHEVISYLSDYGFSLVGVYNPYYSDKDQKCVQADFLFSK